MLTKPFVSNSQYSVHTEWKEKITMKSESNIAGGRSGHT